MESLELRIGEGVRPTTNFARTPPSCTHLPKLFPRNLESKFTTPTVAVCTLEFHVLHVVVPHYHHDFLGLEGMVKGVDTSVGVEGYGRRVLTRKGANGERF